MNATENCQTLPAKNPGPCQLCGNKDLSEFDIPGSTTLWHCDRCDLYQYGQMADNDAYRNEYHDGYQKHRAQKVRTAMARLNRVAAHVKQKQPRVLDIGSSVGCTLEAAELRGWNPTGVDVSDHAVDYCMDRGLDCRLVDGVELPFDDETFDLVVSWHVIEHVENVRETLREWRRVIKPGGLLFFETPNGRCRKVRRLKERYRKFWAPEHTYTFTPENLGSFVAQSGFELLATPVVGPLKGNKVKDKAWLCSYQAYQGLRMAAGLNKAFQVCARKLSSAIEQPLDLPNRFRAA